MDRQHIQLALPWRGSSAIGMSTMPNDTPSAHMCPRLYRAVCERRPVEELTALLLQQHAINHTGCFGKIGRGRILDSHSSKGSSNYGIIQHGWCHLREVAAGGNTVLHVAAEKGNDELIQGLYDHFRFREEVKSLLSYRNSAQDTPLHCAARVGSDRSVAVLIELAKDSGVSILGCKNEAGDTALHVAARHGHGDAVKVLASASAAEAADVNTAGVSPLYLAVVSRSIKAVEEITKNCVNASSKGPDSQNALHAAVFQGKEMVDLLMEWKPALAAEGGCSPLHYAASDGNWKIVEAILRAAPPRTVYQQDNGGLSALHVAARMGHLSIVKKLLKHCPDTAELRDSDGRTFLHTAAMEKHLPVVSFAIKKFKAHGLLDAQDKGGNTALHLAVAEGAPRVVEALLRKGKAQADILNNAGHTPFDLTDKLPSYFTMVSVVVTLVAYGARTRPQRQDDLKPWKGSDDVVRGIQKTSDGLAVVAVLIATAAFTAGFNLPGGYGDYGKANLKGQFIFTCFLFFDTLAVVTSVVAAILLVFGKASCSAGSWKSFVVSLHCMWVSLISLMLAFDAAALVTVGTSCHVTLKIAHVCIQALIMWIMTWVAPGTKSALTNLRFLWQRNRSRGRRVIKRQYPLAGAAISNLLLFMVTNFLASIGFLVIFVLYEHEKHGPFLDTSIAPSPAPL
ncbi:unnamed protein product [Urochloa decumbens]|uniref:PGG domain-containing protein n=1 Tax=Urochloa decumbens TaxID=240449 RepID=A0ABC9ASJ1_9POAL